MKTRSAMLTLLGLAAILAGLWGVRSHRSVEAADHAEAPTAIGDPGADIADFYAWHDSVAGRLVTVVTFDALQMPGGTVGSYDDMLLYGVHIDRDGDNLGDIEILTRFGQNAKGEWGVQVENLPGTSGPIVGRVESVINAGGGAKVFAGLRDDPFFFDLEGYLDTLSTSTLSFDNTRDSLAGTNVTALVLEMDLAEVTDSGLYPNLQLWATSWRR
jgi:hypothetical protein